MNILVTGANGQLGNEIRIVSKEVPDNFIFTDVCEASGESVEMLHKLAGSDVDISSCYLDITDIDAVREIVASNDIKIIINCAAYTNVEAAESNYDLAEKLNAEAPNNLAIVMKEAGGFLIHISTDYVFGKEPYNTPCCEDQKGTPTGVYGLTKLHGEKNIIDSRCDFVIIRTAWLYSEFGRNFLKTMLNLISTKPTVKVVFDQVGTPTYALDLAYAIMGVIDDYKKTGREHSGVYHFSNEGVCSWYDFAKMIQAYSGYSECDVMPCHSRDFNSSVERPAYSVLDKSKIKEQFPICVPYWVDSLKFCLNNIMNF